jgi:hypothetical protein
VSVIPALWGAEVDEGLKMALGNDVRAYPEKKVMKAKKGLLK